MPLCKISVSLSDSATLALNREIHPIYLCKGDYGTV